jgi:16S rRNA C1402 N4-methylase RsmH
MLSGKFSDLKELLDKSYSNKIDAALIDCGVSSIQFDTAARGFSLSKDGPLDMRMDGLKYDEFVSNVIK